MRGKRKDRSPQRRDLCHQQSPKDTLGVGEARGLQNPPQRSIHINILQTLLHIPHLGLNRNRRPSHLHLYQNNGNGDTNPALFQGPPRYHWLSHQAHYKVPKSLLNNPFAMKRPQLEEAEAAGSGLTSSRRGSSSTLSIWDSGRHSYQVHTWWTWSEPGSHIIGEM